MKRTEHKEEKWEFPFVEWRYEGETNEKPPLVVQLHGAGGRGDGSELSKFDSRLSDYLKDAEDKCIVVTPMCPQNTFWAARVESIISFIEKLIKEYDADADRVYLTGHSMGGFGTWYTAMARPDMFAAIAPICGGGMAWNAGVLNMPIWTFHGAEDDTVSPRQTDEMVEALRKLGKDVKYTRLDGVGHNAWDYAYNGELMEWLLGKSRK